MKYIVKQFKNSVKLSLKLFRSVYLHGLLVFQFTESPTFSCVFLWLSLAPLNNSVYRCQNIFFFHIFLPSFLYNSVHIFHFCDIGMFGWYECVFSRLHCFSQLFHSIQCHPQPPGQMCTMEIYQALAWRTTLVD